MALNSNILNILHNLSDRQKSLLSGLLLLILVGLALFVRFGFLSLYPNEIFHEDSGPYVFEAERLLEGNETQDGLPGRPPGYPLFLAALMALVSPNLLAVIAIQHLLGVLSALLLTICLRMLGVSRTLCYLFFLAVALSHRLIHYDNTIGAETLTGFLIALEFFIVCGIVLRRWNPWYGVTLIGILAAYMLLVRTASLVIPILIGMWIFLPTGRLIDRNLKKRVYLAVLVVLPAVITAATMILWNKTNYQRAVISREAEPNMAFMIAYSGDMTGGKYIELKNELKPIVDTGRATLQADGYSTVENYQWVYNIFDVLDIKRLGSQQEKDRVVSGLFWETVLSPDTLYHHITGHTLREMRFMLFDSTPVANSALHPLGNLNFTVRDSALLNIAVVRTDLGHGEMLARAFPDFIGAPIQNLMNRYLLDTYVGEYKKKPGLMRLYSTVSLLLLAVFIFTLLHGWKVTHYIAEHTHVLAKLPAKINLKLTALAAQQANLSKFNQIAMLASLIWLANCFIACFLVYALHRYSYYVLSFNAFTAFYALSLVSGGMTLDKKKPDTQ